MFAALIATKSAFSALSQVLSSPARISGLSENLTFKSANPKSLYIACNNSQNITHSDVIWLSIQNI